MRSSSRSGLVGHILNPLHIILLLGLFLGGPALVTHSSDRELPQRILALEHEAGMLDRAPTLTTG